MNRLQEIEQRLSEIRTLLSGEMECDVTALEKEITDLQEERAQIQSVEKRKALAAGLNSGEIEGRAMGAFVPDESNPKAEAEKRGKALKENRSITVGSSTIILATTQATEIKPGFNVVSSLIDGVTVKPLNGGESYQVPYVDAYGAEGGYTDLGTDYSDTNAVFKYAEIVKTKVTAYSEEPEEMLKLTHADYDSEIQKNIRTSLRRKLAREILVGTGGAGKFAGIFSTAATAIDVATDLTITAIDENTLDDILFAYGGLEDVEDDGVLILSKADLRAFAKVRGTQDKKKVYDIKLKGGSGTINDVPFVINSACKVLATATTGQYLMAYGPLSNYQITVFSDTDIQRSTDYKFKQGLIAHKGVVFAGGNVVKKNGFVRVKKG